MPVAEVVVLIIEVMVDLVRWQDKVAEEAEELAHGQEVPL
jgi:hypothetical protein